ncbi:DUF1345 domain-containing protein [Lacisediminihabitans sp. FW035]
MHRHHATVRLVVMLLVGLVATLITGSLGEWAYAPTVGWCFAALVYSTTVWVSVAKLDATQTRARASQEEPARGIADLLVLMLSVASLFSVAFVLVQAAQAHGLAKGLLAALALVSVALSWILLHTLYTLRYASQYYTADKGIDFNQDAPPQYTDFAYVSFTLGMTYQVSDTDITNHTIRSTVLRHTLLSFIFGSVILATTINLVAGLSH